LLLVDVRLPPLSKGRRLDDGLVTPDREPPPVRRLADVDVGVVGVVVDVVLWLDIIILTCRM